MLASLFAPLHVLGERAGARGLFLSKSQSRRGEMPPHPRPLRERVERGKERFSRCRASGVTFLQAFRGLASGSVWFFAVEFFAAGRKLNRIMIPTPQHNSVSATLKMYGKSFGQRGRAWIMSRT